MDHLKKKNIKNIDKKILNNNDFKLAMNEYKEYLDRAVLKGTKVINGIDINYKLLIDKLKEDNIIILAGEINNIFHAILISGYEKDKFVVCDPLYKNKQIRSQNEIENFMNTSIEKWFISVNKGVSIK